MQVELSSPDVSPRTFRDNDNGSLSSPGLSPGLSLGKKRRGSGSQDSFGDLKNVDSVQKLDKEGISFNNSLNNSIGNEYGNLLENNQTSHRSKKGKI